MANKITCTCGHSWDKSDSSKKDAYVCHICGKNIKNMQLGGNIYPASYVPQAEEGWLERYADGGSMQEHQENYNDSSVSMGPGFVGMGNNTKGRNYSPAWGGQFAMGGNLPGATRMMYARVGAPSKGPHRNQTDVTDASAQNGKAVSDNTSVKKPVIKLSADEINQNKLKNAISNASKKEQSTVQSRGSIPDVSRKQAYEDAQKAELKNQLLKGTDIATDVMQVGNFIPHPIGQAIGKVGNVLGGWLDSYEAINALNEGNYGDAAMNAASVALPMVLGAKGYRRDMWNTEPGSVANRIASLGNREGRYIHLTPPNRLKNNPVIKKGVNFNRSLLGALGAETAYDSYQNGGDINSAQDGEKVEYKELPEITIVGSKDKSTRDFYNNLIDKLSRHTDTDNPFMDQIVMGKYLGLMNLGKEYGFPKVNPETNEGIFKNANGHYNPLTKTIYANDVPTWVSEMAHHVQMKDNIVSKGLQWLGNDLVEYAKQPVASLIGNKLPDPYKKPGTVEYEAHRRIEPILKNKLKKAEEEYRNSETSEDRKNRFYAENPSGLKNGGEMSFYQNGLDWTPKNISRDGSVIKDDRGQWAHPGEITEIGSNQITMKGVPYPVLGVSDEGDTKMMYPGEDYKFKGKKVTEYPVSKKWLDKYGL